MFLFESCTASSPFQGCAPSHILPRRNTLHHRIQDFRHQYLYLDQHGLKVALPFFPVMFAPVLRPSLSDQETEEL